MSQSIPTGYISPGQPRGISSKNLPGDSGEISHLEKFDTYQAFANEKRIPQWTTAVNTISLCMYIFIVLIHYQG